MAKASPVRYKVPMFYPNITALFEKNEAATLAAPKTSKQHPLARLLSYAKSPGEQSSQSGLGDTVAKTDQAIRAIRRRSELDPWLRELVRRAEDLRDYRNSSAALAEIRALGSMVAAGMPVQPVPRSKRATPDFRMVVGGINYNIEVICKQMHEAEADKLAKAAEQPFEETGIPGVTVRSVLVSPLGRSPGETSLENAAQKFAQTKSRTKQAVEGEQNLLWLDLEDEDYWALNLSQINPVNTFHCRFYGGALWYGFFGVKGLPLLEHHHLYRNCSADGVGTQLMRFDGKFRQPDNRFDGAFISLPEGLCFLDNPWRTAAFSGLSVLISQMLRFRFEQSWVDWPRAGSLSARVDGFIADIHDIAARCAGSTYPDAERVTGANPISEWVLTDDSSPE